MLINIKIKLNIKMLITLKLNALCALPFDQTAFIAKTSLLIPSKHRGFWSV